jgi:hypothetical protein
MTNTEPLPLFYSLNRFLEHDDHIGAGSVEICTATFGLGVVDKESNKPAKISHRRKARHLWMGLSLSLFPRSADQGLQEIWSTVVRRVGGDRGQSRNKTTRAGQKKKNLFGSRSRTKEKKT